MADAFHYQVDLQVTQLLLPPAISMARKLYTKMAAVSLRSACAMWICDVIKNALSSICRQI